MTTDRSIVSGKQNIDIESISAALADGVVRVIQSTPPTVYLRSERLVEACRYLKETKGIEFDYLINLTAVDWYDHFEVVYHLHSIPNGHALTLKVEVERECASIPSVADVWRGADFQEREVYDMMGITFVGHPNLKRILLYDEFVGHPLRKDFALPKDSVQT